MHISGCSKAIVFTLFALPTASYQFTLISGMSSRKKQSWGGGGKRKGGGGRGGGGHAADEDDNDNQGRDNREEFDGEQHKGSFSIEELKACEEYSRKIDYGDAPKRKWALNFGYLGSQYQGLQVNPDANTVEKHLEKALFFAGGIAESNYANLHKIQWTRTARTDRGVHAVMQCCAMKLMMPLNGRLEFMNNVNSFLPADIKMHSLSKVTKNFNSKMHCSKRRYHYLLPTYLLQDKAIILDALNAAVAEQKPAVDVARAGGYADLGSEKFLGPEALGNVKNILKTYRIDATRLALLRSALKSYEGTQSYHNFTTGKHPTDANSKRYVISFTSGEPFVDLGSDSEWVLLSVVGQSFLLNQIRKMIGLCVEVTNGHVPISMMKDALSKQKVEVPMAPGVGLYLDELFFEGYNSKQEAEMKFVSKQKVKEVKEVKVAAEGEKEKEEESAGSSLGEVLKWSEEDAARTAMVAFREGTIWPHILREDLENFHFLYYMDYLRVYAYNFHIKDFKDRVEDKDDAKVGGGDRGNQSWKNNKKQKTDDTVIEGNEGVTEVEVVVEIGGDEMKLGGDAVILDAPSSIAEDPVVEDIGSTSGI